jgi:hemoglobin
MSRLRTVAWTALLTLLVVNLAACASSSGGASSTTSAASPSLYKRLGGREGIALVVGDFVNNMAQDPRVNGRFKDVKPADLERFKSNLADQICDATGGPCSYLGKDMKTAHKNMNITEAEWNATVENLGKALTKQGVPAKEQSELVAILAPMKGDIVGQ